RANLRPARSNLILDGGAAGAYVTGFESPLTSERSVVVNGTRINSLVADEQYHVGELGWFRYLQWLLAHNLG
ncbi:hypothetical protein, partial [Aquipseudomonas alcaligenes]|uniref:hypothetical protein n=1 Tax=Aquipseudomonas alcaligenes TaxID=43263 RepID=UPI001C81DECD